MSIDFYPLLIKVDEVIAVRSLIVNGRGCIRHVIWNGATTAGHKASLVDQSNNILWQAEFQISTNGGPSRMADLNINLSFDGLYCDDLDSGNLLIYLDQLRT